VSRNRSSLAGVFTALVLCAAMAACRDAASPAPEPHLPEEWRRAEVDPDRGGRFLPAANRELRSFQAAVVAAGSALPSADYEAPGTVVFAVSARLPRSERRLEILLQHELPDPESRLLLVSDRDPAETAQRLGIEGLVAAGRVLIHQLHGPYASHPSFPFVRDYAPLVRVRADGGALRTRELVAFRGSRLNRVVDASLDVVRRRSAADLEARFEATEELQRVYAERLGPGVRSKRIEVLMDGGNLLSDGRGTCFATQVMIDKNGGARERVERELREGLGCARTLFLSAPKRLDEVQHVDTLLFFADAENVVLSMPMRYESDLVAEFDNLRQLLSSGYRVHRIPRPTASISYANVLVTRSNVFVPQYTVYRVESPRQEAVDAEIRRLDRVRDRAAIAERLRRPTDTVIVRGGEALERDNQTALAVAGRLFPDRQVIPVNSDETIGALGSWHCLSHGLPERIR